MAVTAYFYAEFFVNCFTGGVGDTTAATETSVTLHTSTYTPNQDTHNDAVDADNEVTEANGYLAGFDGTGEVLAATPTISNTLNVVSWDGADPVWTATGAGITARTMILADITTAVAATSPLIWFSEFGQDETASGGGTFTYTFGSSIGTITPADATGFPA